MWCVCARAARTKAKVTQWRALRRPTAPTAPSRAGAPWPAAPRPQVHKRAGMVAFLDSRAAERASAREARRTAMEAVAAADGGVTHVARSTEEFWALFSARSKGACPCGGSWRWQLAAAAAPRRARPRRPPKQRAPTAHALPRRAHHAPRPAAARSRVGRPRRSQCGRLCDGGGGGGGGRQVGRGAGGAAGE
jgi:hypothetical protein